MAACATTMDATRNGQPVIDTTVSAILDDSDEWEGKWVRVSGWIDRNATLLVGEREDYDSDFPSVVIHLDPSSKLAKDDSASGLPDRFAIVSGQVDLTCVHFWANGWNALLSQGVVGGISVSEDSPMAYCGRANITNLVNVLVTTPPETRQ